MVDEFGNKNPKDLAAIFERLEERVIDLSHNMPLLMVAL